MEIQLFNLYLGYCFDLEVLKIITEPHEMERSLFNIYFEFRYEPSDLPLYRRLIDITFGIEIFFFLSYSKWKIFYL